MKINKKIESLEKEIMELKKELIQLRFENPNISVRNFEFQDH